VIFLLGNNAIGKVLKNSIYSLILALLLGLFLPVKAAADGRISGYLRDYHTGEPIAYANVVLVGTGIGAASDVHGHYVIPGVPIGEYQLKAMMMGYQSITKSLKIDPGADIRLDLEFKVEAIQGEAVEVTAERTRFEEKVEISRMNLSLRDIVNVPAMVESDIFRTLQMTPSVQSANDFSAALIVRGGSPDENLILLDGIEVYNPYHLGGVFSTFNTEALADAEFLAGGFPSQYGNRNSAVLNITSREGNSKRKLLFKKSPLSEYWNLSQLKAEISMLSSKLLAEGPIKNGSWMWAVRRTYYDQLAKLYYQAQNKEPSGAYFFWDSHSKILYDISPKDRITLAGYYGRDFLKFNYEDVQDGFDIKLDWGNYTSSLQWRHVPNSKFHSLLSIARTQYDWDFDLTFVQVDSSAGKLSTNLFNLVDLKDWTIKEKLDWFISEAHTVSAGFEYKILEMSTKQAVGDLDLIDQQQSPYILSVFIQDKWKLTPLLNIQPGFRLSKYELHESLYFEPRLGFKYLLSPDIALKGSWGIYKQFLFNTSSEEEIMSFVDLWYPIPDYIDAQSAQHYILGIESRLNKGLFAHLEAYYKPYDNALDLNPKNDPSRSDDDFISGNAFVYGLEVLLQKSLGKISGWIGYSYSRLTKKIDFNSDGQIKKSRGEIYHPKYDQPHAFNCVLSYQLNQKNSFGLTVAWNSGKPYTPVVGKTYTQSNMGSYLNPYADLRTIPGRRNSVRYPFYFRSDISWQRTIEWFGIAGRFKFQIINFTNHFNTLFYYWQHNYSPSRVKAFSMFPIIPSVGLEFEL